MCPPEHPSVSLSSDRRVAVVVEGRLDPIGNRATALTQRTWAAARDLHGMDVFYSFADPLRPEAVADLRAYLPDGPPPLTEGAVFGSGDVVVAASGGDGDPKARLLSWVLVVAHLVDAADHDAYLLVDPYTHVDLDRLVAHVDTWGSLEQVERASLAPGPEDAVPEVILLGRAAAERIVSDRAQVLASAGASDPLETMADWVDRELPSAAVGALPGGLVDLRTSRYVDQVPDSIAICHRFAPERVHELQWFHQRHHRWTDPGFAVAPTRNVAANDQIFVQIPSYRDPELPKTIRSLIDQADDPERLRFGICWQYDEWTANDLDPWLSDPRFRIDEVYYRHARGCSWARARVNRLYQGEGYTLQIDSHMRFAAGWDRTLVDMLESIDSPKPVLTTYPPGFHYDDDGNEVLNVTTGIQRVAMVELGPDLTGVQAGEMAPDPTRPGPSLHLAGGFVFTHGRFVVEVPSDPRTYFDGEELALAARAFTHGYDLFYPCENVVWHLYYQPAPKHWADSRTFPALHEAAVERLRVLLIGDHSTLGEHGVGSVRSIADYERYAGLDFRAARHGLPQPRLMEACVNVDVEQLCLERRDDYEQFVLRLHDAAGRTVHRVTFTDPAILRGEVTSFSVRALVPGPLATYSLRVTRSDGELDTVLRPPGARAGRRPSAKP